MSGAVEEDKILKGNLTEGSTFKNLILFSLPYLLSSFLQTFYGLADLFIAGKYNGANVSSAISIGGQIMHMITLVIVGIAMGSTVLISQSVGANDKKQAAKAIGNTVTITLIISVILTVTLVVLTNPIVKLMFTPKEAVLETRAYLKICFMGVPFIAAYNIISCILRGLGDSKSPMYFVAVACVFNIGIDFLLIGHFAMGAKGAAYGTVISQTIAVLFALIYLRIRRLEVRVSRADFMPEKKTSGFIFKVGIPVAVQDFMIQVSFIVITMIANDRGVIISASVGIVEKIIGFVFLVPSAMLATISALAAQNVGAGKHERARETLKYGLAITFIFGLVVGLVCQFVAGDIVDLFTNEGEVIKMGAQYLKSYIFDCAIAGIHFCFSGFFCAYGKSIYSFVHNILSAIIVRIPGAYLASKMFPLTLFPMGMAAPLGSLFSAVICYALYLHMRNKQIIK